MVVKSIAAIAILLLAGGAGYAAEQPACREADPGCASEGQVIVWRGSRAWLGRKVIGPLFLCGPGDPEGFLYRGEPRPDGTRDSDQMQLIEKLAGTGANCIYLMAVRSHGGDGDATHNPFIGNDPANELNPAVLDQWEEWFAVMDRHGIVIFLFLYDDSTRLWRTGDAVGEPERRFVGALVDRFEHHRNLIWCIAEEYAEALSPARATGIAALIRAADDHDHPIAIHKNHGLDFAELAEAECFDQFAIQYNVETAEELHAGMVQAWREARGRYNLNMSEAAEHGTGREARLKNWACAMGGAYVMVLGMDIASTTMDDLRDCGRLVRFFESTDFTRMAPHDELAAGETKYVLALPGRGAIAYSPACRERMGVRGLRPGTYELRWMDCVTGRAATQQVRIDGDEAVWPRPGGMGEEIALYVNAASD